jgi:hypothetical protein
VCDDPGCDKHLGWDNGQKYGFQCGFCTAQGDRAICAMEDDRWFITGAFDHFCECPAGPKFKIPPTPQVRMCSVTAPYYAVLR